MKNQVNQNVLAFNKSSLVELNNANLQSINSGGLTTTADSSNCTDSVVVIMDTLSPIVIFN